MIYLLERQFGFDAEAIAFPSIGGCHAVVYLTSTGLYGFHNFGGSGDQQTFDARAAVFKNYAKDVASTHAGTGKALYSVCSRGKVNSRGYPNKNQSWMEEMTAYATAFGFKGPYAGYDLDKVAGWTASTSAFVVVRKSGDACTVGVSMWTRPDSTGYDVEKRLPATPNEKKDHKTMGNGNALGDITILNQSYVDVKPKKGYEPKDVTTALDRLRIN
jgi:hypothetical protein